MRLFTTPQVAEILDMPMRKIISYTERGYLEASVPPDGHGSKRRWTPQDMTRILVIRKCEEFGLSVRLLRILAEVLEFVVQRHWHWIAINEHGDISHPKSSLEDFVNASSESLCLYISLMDMRLKVEELIKNAGF